MNQMRNLLTVEVDNHVFYHLENEKFFAVMVDSCVSTNELFSLFIRWVKIKLVTCFWE